jgi:hypothetical protein
MLGTWDKEEEAIGVIMKTNMLGRKHREIRSSGFWEMYRSFPIKAPKTSLFFPLPVS